MFRIESCAKQQVCIDDLSEERASSDGGVQELGNDVRRDSESIATKICSQIGWK